ncbi:MAG: DUF5667 domain-containing protein, partial [Actinomycetota bacterium]
MADRRPTEKGFNDLLEGRPVEASPQLERLRKVATALEPADRPSPSPQFRARLRNELLARAAASDEDVFAALLDGLEIDAPEPVKQLVAVAAALEPAGLPTPDPVFRFALRNRLLAEAERQAPFTRRARNRFAALNERMRGSLRLVVSAGLAATLLAGAGATMAAAQRALPGDALYPVKLFRESAQLAVSSGTNEGIKRLDFARTRLQEIRGLEHRGSTNAGLYIATLDRMDSLTQTGTTMIIDEVRHGARRSILGSVKGFAAVQEQDLQAILPTLPASAQPAARDSLTLLQLVTRTVNEVLANCPCNPPSNPLIPRSSTQSSTGVTCSCDQAGSSGG